MANGMFRDVTSAYDFSRRFAALDDMNRGMREKAERERKAAEAGADGVTSGTGGIGGIGTGATVAASIPPVSQDPPVAPVLFSQPARAVLDAGRRLYRHYHAQPGAMPDASFYDIRAHFQGFNAKGHMNPDSPDPTYSSLIADLRAAMKALAAQIAQKVHEHGFLK